VRIGKTGYAVVVRRTPQYPGCELQLSIPAVYELEDDAVETMLLLGQSLAAELDDCECVWSDVDAAGFITARAKDEEPIAFLEVVKTATFSRT
jgi:hypothetical protein